LSSNLDNSGTFSNVASLAGGHRVDLGETRSGLALCKRGRNDIENKVGHNQTVWRTGRWLGLSEIRGRYHRERARPSKSAKVAFDPEQA
jgi:hypothetical protein